MMMMLMMIELTTTLIMKRFNGERVVGLTTRNDMGSRKKGLKFVVPPSFRSPLLWQLPFGVSLWRSLRYRWVTAADGLRPRTSCTSRLLRN